MRIEDLLTEEDKGILDVTKDFFKGIWNNKIPEEQYKKYLDYAVKRMNYTRDKDLVKKLAIKFPELKDNNTDLNRIMTDIKRLRQQRGT